MKIGGILLAAGASTRMGRLKQLLPVNNQSLIRYIIHEVNASSCHQLTVVLGAHAKKIQEELKGIKVDLAFNPDWPTGMGSSIARGVKHQRRFSPDAYLLLLCDQPHLTTAYIDQLIAAYAQSPQGIIASSYAHTIGVPAIFKQTYTQSLLNLREQGGAKKLFKLYEEDLTCLPFPLGETDLDTPDDYEKFRSERSEVRSERSEARGQKRSDF